MSNIVDPDNPDAAECCKDEHGKAIVGPLPPDYFDLPRDQQREIMRGMARGMRKQLGLVDDE